MNTVQIKETLQKMLSDNNVDFHSIFVAKIKRDDWECFKWTVVFTHKITKETTLVDYHKGLAHVKNGKPTAPTIDEIVYSLNMDAQIGRESFEDYCSNFGTNQDSIKEYKIWESCKEAVKQLEKLFTKEQINQFDEIFEDY